MRTVTVTAGETIQLGYQYDNEATQIIFPSTIITAITDVFGTSGTFAIWYRRSGDALGYPIGYPLVTYASDQVTWTLTEADMANPGQCQIQLRYIVDDVCVMSQMFMGIVSDSVDIGTTIPEPMEAWADALAAAAVSGISDDIKDALLDCFAHVAWIDDQGQTYYDALEDALYPPVPVSSVTVTPATFQISSIGGTQQLTATILPSSAQATVSWSSSDTSVATVSESGLVTSVGVGTATITATAGGVTGTAVCTVALPTLSSISAVYTQSGTVYDTDSLDSLKTDLVVTATYSDSSTETVPSTDYTLSGTLTAGTSTITVSYSGKTTTFSVTVTAELPSEYQKVEWVGAENTNLTPSSNIVIGNAIPSGSVLNIYAEVKPLVYVGADTSPFGGYAVPGSVHSNARFYPYYNSALSSVTPYGAGGVTASNNQCAVGDTWDTVKFTASNPDDALKFFIFSGIETGKAFNGKIHVLDLVKANGDTLYHFIPCYRKADNVIGFYDPVTETFYTGTGTFIKGSNV